MNEEKPLELEKAYIVMNPKQWLDIGNALLVAGNQLDFAQEVHQGDPILRSNLAAEIHLAIKVLNKVHASSKDFMDDHDVSANVMLESIHDQLVGLANELYPLLNEEDKNELVEETKAFSKKLNSSFAEQVFTRLSDDEEVLEKFPNEGSLRTMVDDTYDSHLDGMVDEAFGEVIK